jgi:hypothetical protein
MMTKITPKRIETVATDCITCSSAKPKSNRTVPNTISHTVDFIPKHKGIVYASGILEELLYELR